MFVRDVMSTNPITVTPDVSVMEALEIMKRGKVRRLPVVQGGKLVGIVTDRDLLQVSPSPATSLSVFEINYLVSKMTVREAMTARVIAVLPDDTIEKAAVVMRENKIGAVPVVDNRTVIGIITETDIFDAFLDMLGATRAGVRLTVDLPDRKGTLAAVAGAISEAGANIISVATFERSAGNTRITRIVIRLEPENADQAASAISARGFSVVHKVNSYVQ